MDLSSKSKRSVQSPGEIEPKLSNEDGIANFNLYENRRYEVEVIRPRDGSVVSKETIEPTSDKRAFTISVQEGLPVQPDTVELLTAWIRELMAKRVDSDLQTRLEWRARTRNEKIDPKTMRSITGGRLEELIFRALRLFKDTVFDDVIWNGETEEWGLPRPAQKVSENTGKKLPDIMAFQDKNVCVIETTLLRGRAQWREPEAVSVPGHVEDAIASYHDKSVSGVFIAPKLDQDVEKNLVTRAKDNGYRIVPLEVDDFLKIIETMKISGRDYWENNLATLWNMLKRREVRGRA